MQERSNHLTFFLVSSGLELKEIWVSFSYIPAKPLETKICKLPGHFHCLSNRHFFSTVTLAAHSRPRFGRMFCNLGSSGSDGSSKVQLVPVATHGSTAQVASGTAWTPQRFLNRSCSPNGFTTILLRESSKKSAEWHLQACGRMERVYRKRGKENPEKLL